MKTRKEAVEFITASGYHAQERDWVLGETILVGRKEEDTPSGIKRIVEALYLYPKENEWHVYIMQQRKLSPLEDMHFEELTEAVREVLNLYKTIEKDD